MPHHLITAALPYANGPVHIGHLAGAYLPADVYVRYLGHGRRCGVHLRVRRAWRTDHLAGAEGVSPQQVVDKYHGIIRQSFADFGISFDIYDRTRLYSPRDGFGFFQTLFEKGEFTEESSEQYYDEEAGLFLADRYITGTCPNCGNTNAYGDQCEKCGKSLSPVS